MPLYRVCSPAMTAMSNMPATGQPLDRSYRIPSSPRNLFASMPPSRLLVLSGGDFLRERSRRNSAFGESPHGEQTATQAATGATHPDLLRPRTGRETSRNNANQREPVIN
jgi:hypothetical protein